MIRTLKIYLAKDLVRATLLATVVFTLVMTIFAVVEPLHQRGLSGGQAMKLFVYVMPLMFSLTLPFAALFAATIVYGRFSQDNELMACRASGICMLSALAPAIWLGVVVTVVTLSLSLYIAPSLLALSEKTAKHDLQQIAYHRLKQQRYVKYEDRLFHADEVRPESGWVVGVVATDFSDPQDAKFLTAASAKLEFREVNGRTIAIFYPTNAALFQQSGGTVGMEDQQGLRLGELPSMKDEPKMYNWNRLWRTWARPDESSIVAEQLELIKRKICIHRFYEDVIRKIGTEGKYRLQEFAPPPSGLALQQVEVVAGSARLQGDKGVYLGPDEGAAGQAPPPTVVVREYSGKRLRRELFARNVRITGVWNKLYGKPMVAITLLGVHIRYIGEVTDSPRTKEKDEIGPFGVPPAILAEAKALDLKGLYSDPSGYGFPPQILAEIDELRTNTVTSLLAKVKAEMHQRLGYGLSCMFMVMIGAALGLMLRSGQTLAGFAISAIPASVVILMLLMGRQLIANPKVPAFFGVAAIWGGVGALVLATLYIYAVPMRR